MMGNAISKESLLKIVAALDIVVEEIKKCVIDNYPDDSDGSELSICVKPIIDGRVCGAVLFPGGDCKNMAFHTG